MQDERFARTITLLGREKFQRLQQARVTVVGVGAVGGYVVEALARAGVGNLRLVDFDTIEPSNINRQLLALTDTLGEKKIFAAQRRVHAINPDCRIEALDLFADESTTDRILAPSPDLLIDAIDSLNPKVQLLQAAVMASLPVISSMGAALRTDPSKIRCGDISETSGCPLAKHVRKRLRRRNIESGIPCVYSTERLLQETFSYDGKRETNTAEENHGRQRNILGSLPTITGIFGLYIANEAILRLTAS